MLIRVRVLLACMLALQLICANAVTAHASSRAESYSTEAYALMHLGLLQDIEQNMLQGRRPTKAEGDLMIDRLSGMKGHVHGKSMTSTGADSNTELKASDYAAALLHVLGYYEHQRDFYTGAALGKMVELRILTARERNELKTSPFTWEHVALLTYRALKAPTKNGVSPLAMRLVGQGVFTYKLAKEAGAFTDSAKLLLDTAGVQVSRPVYGELNVVIQRGQLTSQLERYSSVALKSYEVDSDEQRQLYQLAVKELQDGLFDYERMLADNKLPLEGVEGDRISPNSLYRHFLQPDGELLLQDEKQKQFAYILVFYDANQRPLFYSFAELPAITAKLSVNPVIIALMYHHFSEKNEELNSVIVHPDRLRSQIQALKAEGYVSIRQQDLLAYLNGGEQAKLPEKSVLLTFDDGYESNYKLAYPILVEEQFYATIYAITSNVGTKGQYSERLTWPQAREMYNSGYVDIHNHTYDSHYYGDIGNGATGAATTSRLILNHVMETQAEYEKRIREDLLKSKQLIEQQVGNKVITFTYPYGRHNRTLIDASIDSGHSLMYTVKEGTIHKNSNREQLPRINVDGKFTAEMLMKRIKQYL